MGCRGIASPERKRRRIENQWKRRAVAKLARKPKEKNIAKRTQQLAEAQRRFRECNKKSSLEKFFTDSLDVICHVSKTDDKDGGKSFSNRFLKGPQSAYQGTCARDDENTKTYWFPKNHSNLGQFLKKLKKFEKIWTLFRYFCWKFKKSEKNCTKKKLRFWKKMESGGFPENHLKLEIIFGKIWTIVGYFCGNFGNAGNSYLLGKIGRSCRKNFAELNF